MVACHLSFRKDPHGFFAFPVTDAIAPGYSSIIKHPMDFSTMKDRIKNNEYNTVTEFKVRITCRQMINPDVIFFSVQVFVTYI